MTLYLTASTPVRKVFIDFIEVLLCDGRVRQYGSGQGGGPGCKGRTADFADFPAGKIFAALSHFVCSGKKRLVFSHSPGGTPAVCPSGAVYGRVFQKVR